MLKGIKINVEIVNEKISADNHLQYLLEVAIACHYCLAPEGCLHMLDDKRKPIQQHSLGEAGYLLAICLQCCFTFPFLSLQLIFAFCSVRVSPLSPAVAPWFCSWKNSDKSVL